jgi:hypothetical protein
MSCGKIMVIRHAERPSADKSIRGVTQEGVKNKDELTVRGWQRAGALVRFFSPPDNRFVHPALARPEILFACKAGPAAPSLRPQHSLLPLASLIDAALNCDYYEGQEEELVRKAIAAQGAVLIAWKHKTMQVIANAILGTRQARRNFGRSTALMLSGSLTGETAFGPSPRSLSSSLQATGRR